VDLTIVSGQVLQDAADSAADLEHDGVAVREQLVDSVGVALSRDLEGLVGVLIGDRADRVDRGRLFPEPAVAAQGFVLQRDLLERGSGEPFGRVRQLHRRSSSTLLGNG
jgi:hypothetical protein